MSTEPIIYLDLDGVFADFLTGQHVAHGVEYDVLNYPYPRGLWDMFAYGPCPITWESANRASTESFWASLPWVPESHVLYNRLMAKFHRESVAILTNPMMNPGSYGGKARWVRQHMRPLYTRLIMSKRPKGEFVQGNESAVLIDDCDKNVDGFIKAGGYAILVPRPWNSNHHLFNKDDTGNDYVLDRVQKWIRIEGYRKDNYADNR